MSILDYITMTLVFIAVAYIGFQSTMSVKTSNEFILADRKLTKFQAALSTAATDLGGSGLVGAIAFVYVIGLSGAWWNLIAAPAYILIAVTISKKLRSVEVATVSELLGQRYNMNVRVISAILQLLSFATVIASQFLVSAAAIQVMTGLPQSIAMTITVIIVLAYTVGGGLVAVVKTDILQFFILITTVVLTLMIGMQEVGGVTGIMNVVPQQFLAFDQLGFWTPFSWLILMIFGYSTNQSGLQRIFASKDESTAAFAFGFTGIIYIFYGLVVGVLGLIVYILLPGLEDPNTGFALLIQSILPSGLVGFALGGLFAATMSSADSILLAASSVFVNDIYKTKINGKASDSQLLKATRFTTVIVAVVGIGIAQISGNIIQIVYLSGVIYSSVVFFPMIVGIYNKWIGARTIEISIGISLIVAIISEFYLTKNFTGLLAMPSNISCAIASLTTILIFSKFDKNNALK